MEAAIFGLLGTILGGAITVVVAIIKFRQEIDLWQVQFQHQNQQDKHKIKLERYASFIGAYYYVEGAIGDLVDILEQGGGDVSSRLNLVVSDPTFEKSAATLNSEKGWIALLSTNEEIVGKIVELEEVHDTLFTIASRVRSGEATVQQVLHDVREKKRELQPLANCVIDLLKQDAGKA